MYTKYQSGTFLLEEGQETLRPGDSDTAGDIYSPTAFIIQKERCRFSHSKSSKLLHSIF